MAPNANQYSQPQHYAQHHTITYEGQRRIVHYASSQQQHVSRNYTDSQLGLGGRGGGGTAAGQPQQYSSVRSPVHQQYQQQYATPRVPDHELALKDRGSAENSDASEGGTLCRRDHLAAITHPITDPKIVMRSNSRHEGFNLLMEDELLLEMETFR